MSILVQLANRTWPGYLVVLGCFCQNRHGVSGLKETVDSLSAVGHRFDTYSPNGGVQPSGDFQLALRVALYGASPLPPISTDQPVLTPPVCASCIPLSLLVLHLASTFVCPVMPLS